VGWFDVAESRGKRSYSVAAYRTGSVKLDGVPGAASTGMSLGGLGGIFDVLLINRLINAVFFRSTWTVQVAPWYGKRGRRWRERLATEPAADQRAASLFNLIHRGDWEPESGPPPSTAPPT
jgi:hypothetical protein